MTSRSPVWSAGAVEIGLPAGQLHGRLRQVEVLLQAQVAEAPEQVGAKVAEREGPAVEPQRGLAQVVVERPFHPPDHRRRGQHHAAGEPAREGRVVDRLLAALRVDERNAEDRAPSCARLGRIRRRSPGEQQAGDFGAARLAGVEPRPHGPTAALEGVVIDGPGRKQHRRRGIGQRGRVVGRGRAGRQQRRRLRPFLDRPKEKFGSAPSVERVRGGRLRRPEFVVGRRRCVGFARRRRRRRGRRRRASRKGVGAVLLEARKQRRGSGRTGQPGGRGLRGRRRRPRQEHRNRPVPSVSHGSSRRTGPCGAKPHAIVRIGAAGRRS